MEERKSAVVVYEPTAQGLILAIDEAMKLKPEPSIHLSQLVGNLGKQLEIWDRENGEM